MEPISVCIIAKNEEEHIEECCRRLAPYGFEIVVADTGSTDRTVEIAGRYTDRICRFDWCDDFAAAKNFAMEKASHDWILSLDCDEYIESVDMNALAACMKRHPRDAGRILIRNTFTENGQTSCEQVRVSRFVNRRYYRFEGVVHEQLVPIRAGGAAQADGTNATDGTDAADGAGTDTAGNTPQAGGADTDAAGGAAPPAKYVYDAPVTVLHVGYDLTPEQMQAKSRRNIDLLKRELERQGPDPYLYFQLGQSCRRLHDYESALSYFDLGLAMDVDPALDYVQTMVESYGYTLLDLKRYAEALNLLGVYDVFSKRADFVFLMGLIYMNNGMLDQSIKEFEKAATIAEFAVDGVNSYKAFYNIGVIYECSGHIEEAKRAYRRCGGYEPARKRLEVL